MAEQLFFSRDSKMYIEFNNAVWEVPVLDGFSFSQSTNQSEISLSEMQGADGLSRRGNRVFTDSLAPAEWSFSTYVRPYKVGTESHAVEEALWAVMAGADRYIDLMADNGIGTINTTGTISGATNGTYRITSANSTVAANGGGAANTAAAGYELLLTVTGGNSAAVSIVRPGEGFVANDDITIPASVHGGSGALTVEVATLNAKGVINSLSVSTDTNGATPGNYTITEQNSSTSGTGVAYDINITVASDGTVDAIASGDIVDGGTNFAASDTITVNTSVLGGSANLILTVGALATSGAEDAGPNFYRAVNPDTNSSHGPAVVQPGDSTVINFGQSNRSTLGECNLYFVMETSATNPMVYKLQNAAFNEASLDFEVDGIATINWSGFAKNIIDMQSSTTAGSTVTVQANKTISGRTAGDVILDSSDGLKLGVAQSATTANFAKDTGVDSTATFIRNRLTQLLVSTSDTTAFPNASIAGGTGSYSLTLTGGNITISNNISYLVPEELGAVNIPIEHVTGGRTASGSFTCYLTFDADKQGTSVDLFNDMTAPGAGLGLEKVVNDFAVTFQVGGAVSGQPRLDVTIPKCHINVPAHSIEDVISVETNFAAYTDEFNVANEIELTYHGTAI
jgi:hypothetical protein